MPPKRWRRPRCEWGREGSTAREKPRDKHHRTPHPSSPPPLQVDAWIDYTTGEVDAPLLSWFLPLAGIWPHSAEKEAAAKEALKKGLAVLDAHLATRTFLVGDAVTLADIVAACNVFLGYTKLFDATYRKSVPHVTRWYETVSNQPHGVTTRPSASSDSSVT